MKKMERAEWRDSMTNISAKTTPKQPAVSLVVLINSSVSRLQVCN